MAYRRRRNARPKRKAESPEMRTSSVRSQTFATYRRFPQAMQDRFLDGYHSAKDALSEGAASRAPDSPKGWREAIYNWLRLHGDEREQLYMDEPNKQGQAFRRGVKETAELAHSQHDPSASSDWGERFNPSRYALGYDPSRYSAKRGKEAGEWIVTDKGKRGDGESHYLVYADSGAEAIAVVAESRLQAPTHRFNPSARQWNPRAALHVPKHVMAEAQRAGVPRPVVARIASRKETAWEVLPSSLSGLKRRGKTYYLPVQTGYNTDWEYTISKNARGWVARFKPTRRGAKGYYLGEGGSQHRDPEYFRTAKSAFADAVAPHAMSGEYLKYRNPKRRRNFRTGAQRLEHVGAYGEYDPPEHKAPDWLLSEPAMAMKIHQELGISLAEAWAMVRERGVYDLMTRGY